MRIVKYVLLGAAGVIVAAGAVLAYVVATFDPNQYKPQIVRAVKERTQRTLRIDGDIRLSFYPDIGARFGKVSLSERSSEHEFASLRDARVSVKLMPLLSKRVIVDAVEIQGLRVNAVRFKDGTTNFSDLAVAPAGGKPTIGPETSKAPKMPVVIDIARIVVEDSAFNYMDQVTGTKYAVSKFNLKTGRVAPDVPADIDLALAVRSEKPAVDLEGTLRTRLEFDLDRPRYRLDGLDLSARGSAAGIRNVTVSAKGDLDTRPESGEWIASRFVFALSGKREDRELDLKFDIPKLGIAQDRVSGENIVLSATETGGKRRLVARIELPGISGSARAFRTARLNANVDLRQDGATVEAKVSAALAGSIVAERIELPDFTANVRVDNPRLPKNPVEAILKGRAVIDLAKQTAGVNFASRFDESNIRGRAGLAKFAPPAYTFDLDVDRLDADRYVTKGGSGPTGTSPGGVGKPQPERLIDLAALKDLNANGTIRIGALKVSNVKASDVRIDFKAAGGRLEANPVSANLYQGSMQGAVGVSAQSVPQFAVKQNLTGISIGPLLKDFADQDSLEGRGNVTLDITAQGNTASALKKALNGKAAVALKDGAVKGIDIAGSIRSAKARLGMLKGEQVQQANRQQKTDFTELSANFDIRNGVARNRDLDLKSPLLRVGGEGEINIGEGTLNYLVRASIVATTRGQGGRELADLQGVTVPVRVAGPIGDPSYRLDFSALATETVKRKVEEAVRRRIEERLSGGTRGDDASKSQPGSARRLEDAVKGLFGR